VFKGYQKRYEDKLSSGAISSPVCLAAKAVCDGRGDPSLIPGVGWSGSMSFSCILHG